MYVLTLAKELSRKKEHLQDFQLLWTYLSFSARFWTSHSFGPWNWNVEKNAVKEISIEFFKQKF